MGVSESVCWPLRGGRAAGAQKVWGLGWAREQRNLREKMCGDWVSQTGLSGCARAGEGWRWGPRGNKTGCGGGACAVLGKPKRPGQIKKGTRRRQHWESGVRGQGGKECGGGEQGGVSWAQGRSEGRCGACAQWGHDLRKDKLKEAGVRERISRRRQGHQWTEVTPVWVWNGTPSIPHPPSVFPPLFCPSLGSSSVQQQPATHHPSIGSSAL